jgi:quinohemoprotein ethanol dehydrogenase
MPWIFRISTVVAVAIATLTLASAQEQDVAAGEALYDEHCATCHGEKLRNPGGMPDLRNLRPDQRAQFDQIVRKGKGQMPASEGILNDKQLEQLWAYVRARAR